MHHALCTISDPFRSEPTLNKFPSGPLQTAHWQSIGCGRSLLSSGELERSFFQLESSDLSFPELMTALRGSCLLSLCPIEFLPFSLLSSLSWKTSSQCWMVLFCWNSVFRFRRKLCCEHTGSLLDPMHVNTYHAMVVPWSRTHGLACTYLFTRTLGRYRYSLGFQPCDMNRAHRMPRTTW